MKPTLFACLLAGAATIGAATHAAPVQWAGNGHWYEYVATPLTWLDARADALSRSHLGMAGYLATITSAAEDAFAYSLLPSATSAWLGGTDGYGLSTEGNWIWADGPEAGQALTYTNWAPGEPNNLNIEDGLSARSTGQWNDYLNNRPLGYIVEYSAPAPVPLPAGLPLVLTGLGALAMLRRRKDRA